MPLQQLPTAFLLLAWQCFTILKQCINSTICTSSDVSQTHTCMYFNVLHYSFSSSINYYTLIKIVWQLTNSVTLTSGLLSYVTKNKKGLTRFINWLRTNIWKVALSTNTGVVFRVVVMHGDHLGFFSESVAIQT